MIKINKLLKKHRNDWNLVLKEAISLSDSGSPDEAAVIYEAFLDRHPCHLGVLENFATDLLRSQQFRRSVKAFKKLIEQGEPKAHYWLHKGIAEAQLKNYMNARASFEQALRLDPNYALAHNNLGKLYGDQGFLDKAMKSYGAALELDPGFLDALLNRGISLQRLGDDEAALKDFTAVLDATPDHTRATFHETLSLQSLNRLSSLEVKMRLEGVLNIDPSYVDALNGLGLWWLRQGKLTDALVQFDAAIQLDYSYAPGYANKGNALSMLGRHAEALTVLDRALILEPLFAEARVNRVMALMGLGREGEALECVTNAIVINPSLAEGYSNQGLVLGRLQAMEEALIALGRGIRLRPTLAESYHNRAEIFRKLGALEPARSDAATGVIMRPDLPHGCVSYALVCQEYLDLNRSEIFLNRALLIEPESPDANFSRGLLDLLRGSLQDGAEGYEWRWKGPMKRFYRELNRPLWLGQEPIEGKSILVVSEQGLGDAIQMARYLPELSRLGAEIYVEAPKSLLTLFQSLEGRYQFIERGQPLPTTEFQCPVMSLPLAFKTEIDSIPSPVPYLSVGRHVIENWLDLMGPKTKPRIGLAFSGNAHYSNDRSRSIPLELFGPILKIDAEFHVVQKDLRDPDAEFLANLKSTQLCRHGLDDMLETAGLLMAMDLVITVDTSIAHLAGALGCPVWILLSRLPDSRWLLDRDDSPWYPSARLFRQIESGGWSRVICEVGEELGQRLRQLPKVAH